MDYLKFAADNARRQFAPYQLPDGRIVDIDVDPVTSASKGASPLGFTLVTGEVVQAVRIGSAVHPAYVAYLKGEQPDPRD